MRLKDKVAIITGAGAGIGKACAEVFAEEGARVVIAARRANNGKPTAEGIKTAGGEATFIRCDVSVENDVIETVAKTVEIYGGLDIMVNNAAIVRKSRVDRMPTEMWQTMIANNLTSVFYCCRDSDRTPAQFNFNNTQTRKRRACAFGARRGRRWILGRQNPGASCRKT